MERFWPKVQKDDPFGDFINPVEKFVASRTPTGERQWQNTQNSRSTRTGNTILSYGVHAV